MIGKSRVAVALAEAGAIRSKWFGLKVHTPFRTLIVQNENGRCRLKQDFAQCNGLALEDYVRVTPPPPYGLCFHLAEFRDQLAAQIESVDPAVVVTDPRSAAVRDDKAREYLETFDALRRVIPAGGAGPAIGIVAQTRKAHLRERASGRALKHPSFHKVLWSPINDLCRGSVGRARRQTLVAATIFASGRQACL